jgi:hypothetical protein
MQRARPSLRQGLCLLRDSFRRQDGVRTRSKRQAELQAPDHAHDQSLSYQLAHQKRWPRDTCTIPERHRSAGLFRWQRWACSRRYAAAQLARSQRRSMCPGGYKANETPLPGGQRCRRPEQRPQEKRQGSGETDGLTAERSHWRRERSRCRMQRRGHWGGRRWRRRQHGCHCQVHWWC